ncbi:unnamed protein product [Miscanthus lutarioriparius]|uniref:Cytochrome P450 n=1 Tax=Miscanthus lutarioriparius TaxID=422564 RepID=A0A811MAT9_9POAL|nr:unnamed protein product [Miscanthus lutarioriparius]
MDRHNLLYQSLLVCVVTIALIRVLIKLFLTRPPKVRLPAGPWKLRVIGSMHHLVNALPHRALRDLTRVQGPLMMLQLGEIPLVVVSSKEMARKVLKTHDANFATRPRLLSDIVFSPTGEYWRKLRQLCAAEILGPKRVLTFGHIREQEMATEVARIRAAGPSTAVFHNLANSIVVRASFGTCRGKPTSSCRQSVLASSWRAGSRSPTWRPVLAAVTGMRRALEQIHRTVDTTLEKIIKERRGIWGSKRRQGEEDENLAAIFDMFASGTGTLVSALCWGMSELMRNKRVMSKLQGEIQQAFHGKATVTEADLQESSLPYLKLVIKETLRLHPPAPLLVPRESIEACEVEGYTIPARSRVVVNVWEIGGGPKCWDDADEFKPERFEDSMVDFHGSSYEYLPFGAGRRMCPGIAYGLPVIEMVLLQLLYHFNWSLPDGVNELDMSEAHGLGLRRKSPLLLCAAPFVVPESTCESTTSLNKLPMHGHRIKINLVCA